MLSLQDGLHSSGSFVVEAHAVQRRLLSSQAKQPRSGVAGLSQSRHGPQFSEAKAKHLPNAGRNSVFIETGRQTHRIAEATTEQGLL